MSTASCTRDFYLPVPFRRSLFVLELLKFSESDRSESAEAMWGCCRRIRLRINAAACELLLQENCGLSGTEVDKIDIIPMLAVVMLLQTVPAFINTIASWVDAKEAGLHVGKRV